MAVEKWTGMNGKIVDTLEPTERDTLMRKINLG